MRHRITSMCLSVITMTVLGSAATAQTLDRPFVGAVFFYWYEWDDEEEWGNWLGSVHNTPLYGYYDSRKLADNFRSLLLAADWGLTHFFLDYWGHDWRGENNEPRETTVLKAAEKVRALGYPIFIGYYQDGQNFAMRDFWRNISEHRDTYRWLRDYARSPAWTWLLGKPFQMVYARNGIPELTIDHEGFQAWLKQRYGTIDKLNAEWDTNFRDFSDIRMDFNAIGFQRAMSITYQYERWQQDWDKLEQLIRKEFGLPGLRASFDVAYAPFRGFGFEKFARTFGGPHSYAGIFGQPHEEDAQRFLQAAVAKKCGTVFFDHLKHCYFDWNIRVPGTAYPPEPHYFDRFWVGNLMRFVDGVLHMSWNEWWEGSNLEPSAEGGKRFCETNLLYSTIWQLTYQKAEGERRKAEIGLLVNDWIFEHGGGDASDLYNAVQGLRAINAPFEIVLQSEATLDYLKHFRVLVAPSGGVGFGFNDKGERIKGVLDAWLKLGERVLVGSLFPSLCRANSLPPADKIRRRWTVPAPYKTFNFFADIGVSNDDAVLVQGFSHREDWGKLPQGAFGAGSAATVRWTPAIGSTTVLLLPAQPKTNLLFRWHGSAIWRNRVTVFVNEQRIGEVAIEQGWRVYEVLIPADAIGKAKVVEVRLQFAEAHIPGEKEPQRFKGEQRICNLVLDWVQICTPDVATGERKGVTWQLTETAQFAKPLSGSFRTPLQRRLAKLPDGQVLSAYGDGLPRDLLIVVPSHRPSVPSSLLLVNGIFTDDPRWWTTVLERIAKVPCGKFVQLSANRSPLSVNLPDSTDLMSAVLEAGTTKFLLVENRSSKPCKLRLSVPSENNLPIAEIVALSRDGTCFAILPVPSRRSPSPFTDTVHYYAAYQVVFAPVSITTPQWVTFPRQQAQLPLTVQNLMNKPITITLQVGAVIASVRGKPVTVQLKPKERKQIVLPVEVKPFADWGVKTAFVKVTWAKGSRVAAERGSRGETAFFLRNLIIGRNADVHCLTTAVTSHTPTVTLVNKPTTPYGDLTWWHPAMDVLGETAREVEVILKTEEEQGRKGASEKGSIGERKHQLKVGDLRDGEQKQVHLPLPFCSTLSAIRSTLTIRWRDSAGVHERTIPLSVTLLPETPAKVGYKQPDQVATIIVADADAMVCSSRLQATLETPAKASYYEPFVVRLPDGTPLPTHYDAMKQTVHFIIPPAKPSWRMDIGIEGDEKVLVSGFSFRETWAGGTTIRWLPGEGRETVLKIPREPNLAYRLRLHGQAFWQNRVTVYANDRKLGDFDLRIGWQTLTIPLPSITATTMNVRLVFHETHVPAERIVDSTDKRICNFALDQVALEPATDRKAMLLALCRARPDEIPSPFKVETGDGFVRVDNGMLELEWREDAGGTVTKLQSKATGRDYAAQSFGASIGTFGRFDPNRPATNTAQFVVDEFVWQRHGKATVRIVEQNPVWVTVEVTAGEKGRKGAGEKGRQGFRAVQRYRIFANLPLVELTVAVKPLKTDPRSPVPDSQELVVLDGRFAARWWTKSFPNFVGLGDKPPEVYGGQIVHFGWRMGEWVPPVLCLFNPNDLTETLSLLIAENDGANWVRQGFWGEPRGKPTNERRHATIELIAKPPRHTRLRLWLLLHDGHHKLARLLRARLLQPPAVKVVE